MFTFKLFFTVQSKSKLMAITFLYSFRKQNITRKHFGGILSTLLMVVQKMLDSLMNQSFFSQNVYGSVYVADRNLFLMKSNPTLISSSNFGALVCTILSSYSGHPHYHLMVGSAQTVGS